MTKPITNEELSHLEVIAQNDRPVDAAIRRLIAEVRRQRAIIARIDEVIERADATCDIPGITISEAVTLELEEKRRVH